MNKTPLEHARFEEMASAYALGALDARELGEFEAHLKEGCEICRRLAPELKSTADLLLLSGDAMTPPADLRRRILRAAGVEADPGPAKDTLAIPRRGRAPLILALAAAAALAFALWQTVSLSRKVEEFRNRETAVREEIAALQRELGDLKSVNEEQASLIRLLQDPESGLVALASLKPAPNASGKVLWDRKGDRGYLWVSRLPPDPEGKDYQLWAIAGGKPVSAGVFSVSAQGSALVPLLQFPADGAVAAFAVTLEPAGGLPAPSGEMVLIGTIGG